MAYKKETILKSIQWCLDNNRLPKTNSVDESERTAYNGFKCERKENLHPFVKKFKDIFKKHLKGIKSKTEVYAVVSEISQLSIFYNYPQREDSGLISELDAFIEIHKRFPGCDNGERSLRERILDNLSRPEIHKPLVNHIRELEKVLNERFIRSLRISDEEHLERYKSWCKLYGFRPRSQSETIEERGLYYWAKKMVTEFPNSKITKELLKIKKEYSDFVYFKFKKRVDELKEFFKEYKRSPNINSSIPKESSLAKWLYKQTEKGTIKITENLKVIENYKTPERNGWKRNPGVKGKSSKERFSEFAMYLLTNDSFPPVGHTLYNWYYSFNCKKCKEAKITNEKVKNLVEIFNLSLKGDPKAIFIIKSLKEKLKI